MSHTTENLNVVAQERLPTPDEVKAELLLSSDLADQIANHRQTVSDILTRQDKRLLVVVGPCSIHDVEGALDYAKRLRELAARVSPSLFVIMRAYFEKPRTTVGWKGLINDPNLDDTFHIQQGIRIARRLLIDIAKLGLPLSTEALDPISPQYLHDLISWSAIGARTTESQTHREMASGLSSAVGFKNGTDGGLDVAINALQSVNAPHRFLGINPDGQVSVVHTRGNPNAHIVLRGGNEGPNYNAESINTCHNALVKNGLKPNIMVDCSHANSNKNHKQQATVAQNVADQIITGNSSIIGLMLESNIGSGNQKLVTPEDLEYGVSITDACIDWPETESLLTDLASKLAAPLQARSGA